MLFLLRTIRKSNAVFLAAIAVFSITVVVYVSLPWLTPVKQYFGSRNRVSLGLQRSLHYDNVIKRNIIKSEANPNDFLEEHNQTQYFNPYYYNWTLVEKDFCSRRFINLSLLIVVHTSFEHWEQRQLIRDTWGNKKFYDEFRTAVIFAVGQSSDASAQQRMIRESAINYDIIQQNFADTYKNLSLKAIMWLRFVADYCPQVPLILKIDDDIAFSYFDFMDNIARRQSEAVPFKPMSFICNVWENMEVYREGKWMISEEEYPNSTFSTYCSGSAYMLTADLVKPLIQESRLCRLIWIDDFHITGHLAQKVNATFESIGKVYNFLGKDAKKALLENGKIFSVTRNIDDLIEIWNGLHHKHLTNHT